MIVISYRIIADRFIGTIYNNGVFCKGFNLDEERFLDAVERLQARAGSDNVVYKLEGENHE